MQEQRHTLRQSSFVSEIKTGRKWVNIVTKGEMSDLIDPTLGYNTVHTQYRGHINPKGHNLYNLVNVYSPMDLVLTCR